MAPPYTATQTVMDKNKNITVCPQQKTVKNLENPKLHPPEIWDPPQIINHTTLWGLFKFPMKWSNIILLGALHLDALYTLFFFPYLQKIPTALWNVFFGLLGGFGVTGGAHRFWTHRSYSAKLPLRIFLVICYAVAGQNKLYNWVRDHRVHHKFSETDADPHNSKRGFFFAHIGWLMMKKHPLVGERGKTIDFSDLDKDPVYRFHEKYFWTMKSVWCFAIPILVPWFLWDDSLWWCTHASLVRLLINLHCTWAVNSAAHIYGNKPYNKEIKPTENLLVSIASLGEGWHNYHHTFPWDYKAAELGNYRVNFTTFLLDNFAKIGWAYDMKQPSQELIRRTIENKGDGSHEKWGHDGDHHHQEISESAGRELLLLFEDANSNANEE